MATRKRTNGEIEWSLSPKSVFGVLSSLRFKQRRTRSQHS